MSVSGFSVAHDAEVAQYRATRAAFLAKQERQRAAELAANPDLHTTVRHRNFLQRIFHHGGKHHEYERRSVSVGGHVVPSKKLEEDSDFETDSDEVEGFTEEDRVAGREAQREREGERENEKKEAKVRLRGYA